MSIFSSINRTLKLKSPILNSSKLVSLEYISRQYHKFSLSLLERHKLSTHFNQILSHAIASGRFTDPFASSKLLLYSLSNDRDLSFSRSLFFQIQNPNIFAWNFMFKAFSQSPFPEECIALYNLMQRNGTLPDKYTFPFILKACGHLSFSNKGQEIHCSSLKLGLQGDVFVQNALISMYSLCSMLDIACNVFKSLPVSTRDVVSWNSMITGYLQNDHNWDALKVFGEMLNSGYVKLDEVTLVSALTACGRMGSFDFGKRIHGLIVRNSFALNVFLGSSLIDMYAKCGKMENARKVFYRIPEKNVVCWTCMIVGYAQLDMFTEVFDLFREMQIGGFTTDTNLLACVISACGHSGALDQGRWVHTYCERNGIDMNLSVSNALIDMYSKCGDIEKALQIFHESSKRDVFSWTAMISGLAMNGKSDQALDLFAQMETFSNIKPNEITFLGVLSACSHGGFVDKGIQYFRTMIEVHNLKPHIEHYGCVVDLLGRANLLSEAEKFIRTMPIKPDAVIWRSLLFACRSHGNLELAELATDKIEKLDPKRCGGRVLLSNAYASASMWLEMNRVRKGLSHQKIQKLPGCSFVEINGIVHEFFVGDSSHSQKGLAYDTIVGINKVMRSAGFELDALNGIQYN